MQEQFLSICDQKDFCY